jgi:hypothetical protein
MTGGGSLGLRFDSSHDISDSPPSFQRRVRFRTGAWFSYCNSRLNVKVVANGVGCGIIEPVTSPSSVCEGKSCQVG